jgi:hypothetical protein
MERGEKRRYGRQKRDDNGMWGKSGKVIEV